jgi:cellulose synthase/poly-beta-1,6-N-acetylglucosamine synthase-like glycosyltransferase
MAARTDRIGDGSAHVLARVVFWSTLVAIAWAHVGYPAAIAALARRRRAPVRKADIAPCVTVLVAAHDEEGVIRRRVENLLELAYPPERLEIVVVSDASADTTDAIVEEIAGTEPRVRLVRTPRGGKVAALNHAVKGASGEILAFTDANTRWAPDALGKLVRVFADDDVAYVCGRLELEASGGTNRESAYWRSELWLRERESAVGSITGGNGAIYAVRRGEYVERRFGHDLGFPHEMVKQRRRAVYEPAALAFEKQARDLEDEYRRKVRMLRWSWQHVLAGRMLQRVDRLYRFQLVSHRALRYCLGGLHLLLLTSNVALVRRGGVYRATLALQGVWVSAAGLGRMRVPLPGASLAYYYLLMNCATVEALVRYLRSGAPLVWEKAEGTR